MSNEKGCETMDFVKPQRRSNTTAFVDNMVLPVHRWFRYSAGFSAEWANATGKGKPSEGDREGRPRF
jgi:hypothetical protein